MNQNVSLQEDLGSCHVAAFCEASPQFLCQTACRVSPTKTEPGKFFKPQNKATTPWVLSTGTYLVYDYSVARSVVVRPSGHRLVHLLPPLYQHLTEIGISQL
jgi:hypothetical protein